MPFSGVFRRYTFFWWRKEKETCLPFFIAQLQAATSKGRMNEKIVFAKKKKSLLRRGKGKKNEKKLYNIMPPAASACERERTRSVCLRLFFLVRG